jgi:23S rRNA (adenine2503-C2)-methyltransferase
VKISSSLSIFAYSAQDFASLIRDSLGKGYQQALLIYQEWYRSGKISGEHPAFSNAKTLLEAIRQLTDITLLCVKQKDKKSWQHVGN